MYHQATRPFAPGISPLDDPDLCRPDRRRHAVAALVAVVPTLVRRASAGAGGVRPARPHKYGENSQHSASRVRSARRRWLISVSVTGRERSQAVAK
jgi:hypothetical protein